MKSKVMWIVAFSAAASLFLAGQVSAQESKGVFCLDATSELTSITHALTLNYTVNALPSGLTHGHTQFYGAACYVIPGASDDCVAVHGSGIAFESRFEMSLQSSENQEDFGHNILTISNTHIWIRDLNAFTGTWSAESVTYIEGGVQGLRQFDKGTVRARLCP